MCDKLKQSKVYQKVKALSHKTAIVVGQIGQKYTPKIKNILPDTKGEWLVLGGLILGALFIVSIGGHSHQAVGVVDVNRLREMAEPYKEIEREKEKYTVLWRMKFQAEQEILDEEDKKLALAQKKKSMKKKAFKRALDDLQKKSLALQKKYQKEAAKIMMATNSAQKQIDELAMAEIENVAREKGYDIILMHQVLYASETVDVTDDLIEKLNEKAVKINFPDPETLTPSDE